MNIDKLFFPPVKLNKMNQLHMEELEILKELYKAAKEKDIQKTDKLLKEFIEDVKKHFQEEEQLMIRYHYPEYPMHSGDHNTALHNLNKLEKQWEEEKNPDIIVEYLEDEFIPWIQSHINVMDSMTAVYLSQFER